MRILTVMLMALCGAVPAQAGLVTISELLYNGPGADDGKTFVELYGPPGLGLAGWFLAGVNGNGGGLTDLVDLGIVTFPDNGFVVLADEHKAGGTSVANADFLFVDLDFQNGPDSVQLLFGSVVMDALGYGSFGPSDIFAGEGIATPGVGPGESLSRVFADVDTGVNLYDFEVLTLPTPGTGRFSPVEPVVTPEPGTWVLFGTGLVLLAARAKRRGRSSEKSPRPD